MKRIIYTLLAAGIFLSSCQKENRLTTQPNVSDISFDGDLFSSKAEIAGANKNAPDNNLSIDYNLVLKQTSANMYKLKGKLGGIAGVVKGAAGKKIADVMTGMTMTITGPKLEGYDQLNLTLKSTGKNGDVFEFPAFEYKADLDYEIIDVSSSFTIKGGDITFNDASTFTVGGSTITVNNGNFKPGNDFTIKEGTIVTIDGVKLETSFAILYEGKSGNMTFADNSSFFMLPNGKTVEQDPKVVKVRFIRGKEGARVMNMRVIVAGDPGGEVDEVLLRPTSGGEPVSFEKVATDKKVGICCYDRCLDKDTTGYFICGTTDHFKPADFNESGEGWARITLVSRL